MRGARVLPFRASNASSPQPPKAPKDCLTRGVWIAPYLIDDREVLIAVDHTGNRVREIVMQEGITTVGAIRMLELALDAIDSATPDESASEGEPRRRRGRKAPKLKLVR